MLSKLGYQFPQSKPWLVHNQSIKPKASTPAHNKPQHYKPIQALLLHTVIDPALELFLHPEVEGLVEAQTNYSAKLYKADRNWN